MTENEVADNKKPSNVTEYEPTIKVTISFMTLRWRKFTDYKTILKYNLCQIYLPHPNALRG